MKGAVVLLEYNIAIGREEQRIEKSYSRNDDEQYAAMGNALILEFVPFGDLSSRRRNHVLPVFLSGRPCLRAQMKFANYFIFGDAVVVEHLELKTHVLQPFIIGHVKDEAFIEHGISCPFFDMSSLFSYLLVIIEQIYFDVRICQQINN